MEQWEQIKDKQSYCVSSEKVVGEKYGMRDEPVLFQMWKSWADWEPFLSECKICYKW